MTHRSATMTWVMCLWYYSMALNLKLFDLMYNFPNKKKRSPKRLSLASNIHKYV